MKNKKIYCIYAIILDRKVFVGKTTSDDRQSILWRHLRGGNQYTKEHFARGVALGTPHLFPLEHICTDFSRAYRHEVAFIRTFMDEGYEVLNSRGMVEDALDIHPITQEILDSIKLIPLELLLMSQVTKSRDAAAGNDASLENKKAGIAERQKEMATEKLTVRMTPSEKKRFADMAEETGVSQRQLLLLLMENRGNNNWMDVDWSSNAYVCSLLLPYREENAALEKENKKLRLQLKEKEKEVQESLKRREEEFIRNLGTYFGYFTSRIPSSPPLERGLYREHLAKNPVGEHYRYPDREEPFLFFPEKVLLGRGKYAPLFIIGHDRYRQKVLLRFYNKVYFIGFSFTNEKFGVQGSCWLVRCERAKDKAMDLVFAFPLDIAHKDYANMRKTFLNPVDEIVAKVNDEARALAIEEQREDTIAATRNDETRTELSFDQREDMIDRLIAEAKKRFEDKR